MKKKLFSILLFITLGLCSFGLFACNNEQSEHEHNYTTQIVDPTCTEQGYTIYTCECGETYNADNVDALGHSFTDYKVVGVSATDKTLTIMVANCDRTGCSKTDSKTLKMEADIPSDEHLHSFLVNHIMPATCTEDGYSYSVCSCGEVLKNVVAVDLPKLGHSFTNYVSNNDATCEKDGTKTATCNRKNCNEVDTIDDVDSKLGHSFTNYISNNDATDENDGTKTASCDRTGCDKKDTVIDEGSKLPQEIIPTNIYLDNTQYEIYKGDIFAIIATVYPVDAANKTVTWRSSDPEVATVDSYGVVTGLTDGSTIITATTFNGKTTTATVIVSRRMEYRTITLTKANYADFVGVGCFLQGTQYITTSVSYKESSLTYSNVVVTFSASVTGRYYSGGSYSGARNTVNITRTNTGAELKQMTYSGYPFYGDSLTYSFTITGTVSGYFYVD